MEPTAVYNSYWRFAAERQAIYFRRLEDLNGPWTSDPILLQYRFTNVYRASDRVSQYLIREVQYRDDRANSPDEIFFRTILFKLFNRIETWTKLELRLGPLSRSRTKLSDISVVLDELMARGDKIYTAAYITPSPPFGLARKHANHLSLLARMIEDRVPDRISRARDLRSVFEILLRYPGLGPFLAFQFAIDLNYSMMLDHDEASFVVAGPGALDGIAKCFRNIGKRSAEDIIYLMCDTQERAFAEAGLEFQDLFGRRLQPIDCQNLFCEISKYARIAHPDIRGLSGRMRIKQVYRRSADPIPIPFFPARWRLNNVVKPRRGDSARAELGLFA